MRLFGSCFLEELKKCFSFYVSVNQMNELFFLTFVEKITQFDSLNQNFKIYLFRIILNKHEAERYAIS